MPITAVCTGCGKSLKVKDELKGKTIRCPGCKATFTAGATGATPVPMGRTRASTLGEKRSTKGPAFSVNPALILGGLVVVLIVGFVIFWVIGPGKTHSQWNEISGNIYEEVESVTDFCLKAETSTNGSWNPRKAIGMPKVIEINIMGPHMFAYSMPEDINFKGSTSEGEVKGIYHPKTKEIEMDLDMGGTTLSTGIVTRKGTSKLKCTGRMVNGQVSAEINGKKASIYTPPPDPNEN